MNEIQLVAITYRGAPILRYATPLEAGSANAEAGSVMDSLADRYGDGFGYEVSAVPHISRTPSSPKAEELAAAAYESGAWPAALDGELAAARASAAADRQRIEALEEELGEAREALAEWKAKADSALMDSLVFGAADDESRAALSDLAKASGDIPLRIVGEWGAGLVLAHAAAVAILSEKPAARHVRISNRIAYGKESD